MIAEPPLVVTKTLLPRRRPDVLRRARLLDFLHRHVDRRLLLACAPAGYGKTTLLVDFAQEIEIPVCWYTIGKEDYDPKVFFRYLIAAIDRRFPRFGQRTLALLDSAHDVSQEINEVVGLLVNELHATVSDFFFLVLDDYHLLDDQQTINKAVDTLLQYLPDNCHLIISSRTLPKITLSRLAAYQQVAGLGVADLRFTPQEIKDLLSKNYDIMLPERRAQDLAKESEGWISAIILTTHALWQGLFTSAAGAASHGSTLFDYLAAEVFEGQPAEIQSFLLSSSVLEDINAQRCAELFGAQDAAATLRSIEDDNLFLNRLEEDWYRYHNLFREFLLARLARTHPQHNAELHVRAATMAAARGDWSQAIGHYLNAGRPEDAAAVVETQAEALIANGRWETVLHWTDMLQDTPLMERPLVRTYRAWSLLHRGPSDEALQLLTDAIAAYLECGDTAAAAWALTLRSSTLRAGGRFPEAIADCQRALELAADDNRRVVAEALKQLGACHGQQGNFPEAIAELGRALRLIEQMNRRHDAAFVHYHLGVAHAKTGDLAKASLHYERAAQYWESIGSPTHLAQALISVGMLHYYQGDYEVSLSRFEAALAKARESGHLRSEAYALASIADVYRDTERYAEAMERYEAALGIAERTGEAFLAVYTLNAVGNTYRLLGDHARAERTIRRALQQAEERESIYEIGLCAISLGAVHNELEEYGRAVRHLQRAQRLLSQVGARRETGLAHLHLAHTAFGGRRLKEARKHLTAAVEVAAELGYDEFLFVEGRRLRPLLVWAMANQIGGKRLALILQRAGQEQPAAALAPAPAPSPATPLMAVAPPALPALRACALGASEVLCDGVAIGRQHWKTDKAREMLFYFLSNPGWLRRDQIVCALWPDLDTGKGESSFHTTLYRLRHALFAECVLQREGRYRYNPEASVWFDVAEFEAELARAKSLPDDADKATTLRRAIDLYRSNFLEEFFSDWVETRRKRLEQRYLGALDTLARLLAAQGDLRDSLALYETVLSHDAYREDVQREVLKCYALLGDRAGAARQYQKYIEFLAHELGVRPSSRTEALYERIVRGELGSPGAPEAG